jgi:hypothetical protein
MSKLESTFADDTRVLRDVELLERAAREWRWLAWLWVLGGLVFSLHPLAQIAGHLLDILDGANGPAPRAVRQAMFGLVFIFVFFGLISSLYFLIARRIARGQRWAVALALFIAGIGAALTIANLLWRLARGRAVASHMIMEGVMLLAHLNLLRVLFRSYAATLRIRQLAVERMQEEAP